MIVRIGKRRVDVARSDCGSRPCFVLGFDKGAFSQGRGYTSYHTDAKGRRVEKPVCQTRHLHGCPVYSVCTTCGVASILPPGSRCERIDFGCDGMTEARS